jgi:peptidyl-tRNA hydrolase
VSPVQYIFLDRTLDMSTGKAAAQASHASCEGVLRHHAVWGADSALYKAWRSGNHYAKVVLECDDLFVVKEYLASRGFPTELIIDEGRTEFGGKLTPTALGTLIVDKDDPHTKATFGHFDLYGTHDSKAQARVAAELKAAVRPVEVAVKPWGEGSVVTPKDSLNRQQRYLHGAFRRSRR